MQQKTLSALLLAGAFAFAALLHVMMLPRVEDSEHNKQLENRFLVQQYLIFQKNPHIEFEIFENFLKKKWAESDRSPRLGQTVALIYGLEHQREPMEIILREMGDAYDPKTLYFALGYANDLPEQWRASLGSDWTGAKIAALVFQKTGNERGYAEALIKLRDHETIAGRWQSTFVLFGMLRLLGVGLMVSMFLSRRHLKSKGERFFKLTSIRLPRDSLFQFCGIFLVGFILIGMAGQMLLSQQPVWLQSVITYTIQVSLGTYLVKKCLFPSSDRMIVDTLGLSNLKMRPFNLLQIFGGVSILVACGQFAWDLMALVSWPFDNIASNQPYQEIMKDPGASAIFLFVACIIAPIFEEILFRGIILRALLNSYKPWIAFLGSSILFAILHPLPLWPVIFLVGMGLCLIYYRTANILVNIWAHALWNCTALILTLLGIQF